MRVVDEAIPLHRERRCSGSRVTPGPYGLVIVDDGWAHAYYVGAQVLDVPKPVPSLVDLTAVPGPGSAGDRLWRAPAI